MERSAFHFADILWLWGLLAIPAAALLYAVFHRGTGNHAKLEAFADRHLLPHLLTGEQRTPKTAWRSLGLWSLIWACGSVAMAGPRWNYTELETFKPARNLVVLLDLSRSMDAGDVKPSRMAAAREKLEDLLKASQGTNIGLVGYAEDAHMISPLTDDTKPILDLVPELGTSLPSIQGNRLAPALTMASRMLSAEAGNDKSILILSDGGFHDGNIAQAVNETVKKNVAVYTIGIGTKQGAPIPAAGGWIKTADGKIVISHLEAQGLKEVSALRGGFYREADYTGRDVQAVLNDIRGRDEATQATGQKTRAWAEHFILPLMLMALLVLPWFRRGQAFAGVALVFLLALPGGEARASSWQDWFRNPAQQAQANFNKGDYKTAATHFDTPYRRGVAQYKAGDYAQAEKSFAQGGVGSTSTYNRGNALVMGGKYEDAIAAYQAVLKGNPHNANAQHNLDIARKLLALQQKEQQQNKDAKQQDQKSSSGSGKKQDKQQNSAKNGGAGNQEKKQDSANSGSKQSPAQQKQQGQQQADKKGGAASSGKQQPDKSRQASAAQKQDSQAQDNKAAQNQPSPKSTAQSMPESGKQGKSPKQAASASQPEPRPGQGSQAPQENRQGTAGTQAVGQNTDAAKDSSTAAVERPRTQKDIDADQWLQRIENDPQSFLKNQFQIESRNNGTQQGDEPW